ncbi:MULTISPECIES: Fe2+-dependent dioxygenase [Novosphingobium]|uniref:Fe2+-dependent dioxygenase n=1 Tax=unclassified Novosphingobium TaxID=2644732 RepID=UPI0006C86384|nr:MULTISPECIES: Fe2+-dependent dioxygenase [unclassified Novosphingobium]KPH66280.1 Fe(II)-dependent oxygenase [Novosphingobium sp. ST904]MPS70804.1 Fe2+-dependent dioxygenase [Novosphingobium sp.]TCM33724.1 PKHD-type hydroxylase [Novosphingobium sp. ST904]WRT95118.1 Fe2+-dependent dioxygenase [Novosphingobium sp. RL4]
MVIEIPELFSADEVRAFREALEGADWADGRATAGHRAAQVKDNEQLPLGHPLAQQLADRVLARLMQTPLFIAAALPSRVLQPRFSRYDGRGHYGNHVDNAIFPIPGTGEHLRSDISSTLFLSDPDEYDGGELVIEDMFGSHTVKLPAGHLVVYPGSSLHRVEPVTRGTRFVSFFWTQSFVAAPERRRLLLELDGAIQGIAGDHPEHGSIDTLTQVYHNLLRQWSVT